MKTAHIITTLQVGGAEMMLYKLLAHTDRNAFEPEVISLTDIGPIGERIRALGVPVHTAGMRRGIPDPQGVLRVARLLRQQHPDIVQTWMYHADLVGGLAARMVGIRSLIWGVRQSSLDPHDQKRLTFWTARICARLSGYLPACIVCCSEAVRRVHGAFGYEMGRMVVLPNGFDLDAYRPDPAARFSVRQELGLSEATPLIGLVARFHPQKDHRNFMQAAARLHARLPNVHFLLCGSGVTLENPELAQWVEEAGIRANVHLLGGRQDVPRLSAALDIASSSSSGEGFPNVLGEAMACGVPCVVTDVGDSAQIVGETGRVVPPHDSQALADAWHDLLTAGAEYRCELGLAARHRVQECFSMPQITRQYEQLYKEIAMTCVA
jgi:glycosyltransferase involved in cell wall biosynthesis